jgi:hypothetical protein
MKPRGSSFSENFTARDVRADPKGYLHIPAAKSKGEKPRTLAGRSKGWLFPSYREGHISSLKIFTSV